MYITTILAAIMATVSFTCATYKRSYQDNVFSSITHVQTDRYIHILQFDDPRLTVLPMGTTVDGTAGCALFYKSFGYNNLGNSPLLKPDTLPQVVGGGVTLAVTEGQRFWRPMNSNIVSFDEKSIAYACIAYLAVGFTTKTVSCTIQIAGKKKDTGATVVQDLVYDPSLLGTTMTKAKFADTFKGLAESVITLASSPLTDALTVIIIDSHAYDAYHN